MTNTDKVADIAAKIGLSLEQVEGVLAFDEKHPVAVYYDGFVRSRTVYSAERIAERRAELAVERGLD